MEGGARTWWPTYVAENLVSVTRRRQQDGLLHSITNAMASAAAGGLKTVECIGNADAPSIMACVVYAGHKYARELDVIKEQALSVFKRGKYVARKI